MSTGQGLTSKMMFTELYSVDEHEFSSVNTVILLPNSTDRSQGEFAWQHGCGVEVFNHTWITSIKFNYSNWLHKLVLCRFNHTCTWTAYMYFHVSFLSHHSGYVTHKINFTNILSFLSHMDHSHILYLKQTVIILSHNSINTLSVQSHTDHFYYTDCEFW